MNSFDEIFDEDYIDPIDKWILDNNADVNDVKKVSYRNVKQCLDEDYGHEMFS